MTVKEIITSQKQTQDTGVFSYKLYKKIWFPHFFVEKRWWSLYVWNSKLRFTQSVSRFITGVIFPFKIITGSLDAQIIKFQYEGRQFTGTKEVLFLLILTHL